MQHLYSVPRGTAYLVIYVRWPATVTAKELTSRQKEKPHGKKKSLTAKRKRLAAKRKTSRQKKKPHGKKKNLTAKRNTSRQKEKDSRQKEKPHGKRNNLAAKRIRWSAADPFTAFSYPMVHLENSLQPPRFLQCREVEVFLFAVRLFFLSRPFFFLL